MRVYGTQEIGELKPDAYDRLLKLILKDDRISEVYKRYCAYKYFDETDLAAVRAFVKEYKNETRETGIGALIVEIMNNARHNGRIFYIYRNDAIYVEPYIPASRKDKKFYPCAEDIDEVLCEYLSPIFTGQISCNYFSVPDSDFSVSC